MICPECSKENAETNRFCLSCGYNLLEKKEAQKKIKSMAIVGGIVNLLGGGLIILGWLLPWFSYGKLISTILSFLGIGSQINFLNLGGAGSGLKISIFSLVASFAAFSLEETVAWGLLGLGLTVVLALIPIFGGKNIKLGLDFLDLRSSGIQEDNKTVNKINVCLEDSKKRSVTVIIIMVSLFVVLSIIPFASAMLASGFYVTVLGAIITYLGARFTINKKLSDELNENPVSIPPSNPSTDD